MKTKITFIIAFFIISTLKAQTTFEWDTVPYNDDNNIVTQTLDGITTTFIGTADPGIVGGPGFFGDTGNVANSSINSNVLSTSVTFSFSKAVDVQSIRTLSNPSFTYTFTPTGGTNAPVSGINVTGAGNAVVSLNWTGVTSFVVTANQDFVVAFDDLIVTSSTLSTADYTQETINIFPNPVTDFLYFDKVKNLKSVSIHNSLGQLVSETNDEKIDFRNLKNGLYILQIKTDKEIINKRIIKK